MPFTMKTQSPTKNPPAKKAAASTKKSPGTQTIAQSKSTTTSRGQENVGAAQSDQIAALAYKIWQEQGCPEGHEEQHWHQAEQALSHGSFTP